MKEFCEAQFEKHKDVFSTVYDYIGFECKDLGFKNCVVCGKSLKYKQILGGSEVCSPDCNFKNPNRLEKIKKALLEKYGVDNPAKNKEIHDRMTNTCLKRYGSTSPLANNSTVRYKVDNYWKERGVENPGQLEEIKEKIKKTNLERYRK